ncbi:phage tail protein I [Hydrogenophaga sp.]|uniref:phage tail protein I n=1 Tax=Hydrogenophaga sp. TaxID=1904254 RepID=UPI003F72592F
MTEGTGHQLLPPQRSALEEALAQVAELPLDTTALRSLWSAQHCPAPLLPWLSWTLSVESWHEATSADARRNLILASIEIHRRKGTRWAIRALLRALGFGEVVFSERIGGLPRNGTWHRDGEYTRASLEETWATYRIVFSRRITNSQADRIRALLPSVAPARCHLLGLVYTAVGHSHNGELMRDGSYNRGTA